MSATTIIKLISALAALIVIVVATVSIMLPSYLEYQVYYTDVLQNKEYNKYLESLPLEFVGISAELNEGVEFYEGDTPDKDDFLVKAKFTEKGKEFEKILSSDEFRISVPADFSEKGGNVTVSYEFLPAKEEGDTEVPKAVIRSTDVQVQIKRTEELVFNLEAESSDCGTEKTVAGYALSGGEYVSLGDLTVLEGFAKNDKLKFTLTSEGVAFGEAFIRVANTTDSSVSLADLLELKVNGRVYPLSTDLVPAKVDDKDYVFVDFALPALLINGGETDVELTFKKDAAGLAIDKLNAELLTRGATSDMLGFAGTFDLSVGDYLTACIDSGSHFKFTGVPGRGSNGKIDTSTNDAIYTMGGASDGEYFYFSMNTLSNKKTVIYKVEPVTYKIVAKTAQFTVATASGNNSRMFIKDGVLYCLAANGDLFGIKLSDFNGDACEVTKSTDISFAAYGTAYSACWVEEIGRYALMTKDGKLYMLDENLNEVADSVTLGYSGLSISSLTADEKYIYVNYTKDAEPIIPIEVYTWDGVKVGTFSVGSFQLFPASGSTAYNVQSIFLHNGELHIGVCGWGTDSKYYHDWIISMG